MIAMRPAMFWSAGENDTVRCSLCPHNCAIREGAQGLCGARENCGGRLYAANYGRVSAVAMDPIEKKPLRRFHPGASVLSIGGFGCNLRCPFCQNSHISMARGAEPANGMNGTNGTASQDAERLSPDQIATLAKSLAPKGNVGAAYTYNEPLIGYEFLYDCARLVRDAGLRNVVVTNGYINREPLESLLPLIDAMNIDCKGFTDGFYKKLGGGLDAVRETIALAYRHCHVEITTLVIPGENEGDIEGLAAWLASLDTGIPLHLSRFFPRHQYADRAPTPPETIYRLVEIARKHLRHVFAGNLP